MSLAAEMLRHTPVAIGFDKDQLTACIEACFECAQVCTACADACLGEDAVVEWRHCITINLNCADVCSATGRILSRQVGYEVVLTRSALEACRDVCRRCAEEANAMQTCTSTAVSAPKPAVAANGLATFSSPRSPYAFDTAR